jgi:prepilin-type N-terminal cleavage/methylation domain-containing protein
MPPVRSRPAFTLVELMVVVALIGMLASLAIAAMRIMKERSLASRFANDFREIARSFQNYNLERGAWPAATTSTGEIPANMAGYLPAIYTQPSPMGGGYTWSGPTGRLRLINTQATDSVMQRVDAILDDGNLTTGDFSKMVSGGYHWQFR